MAAYSFNSFSSSLLFLLPLFLSISLSTSDLITDICSKADDQQLCSQTLRSDPRSAQADLKGLALISIDIANSNAKQTAKQLIPELSKGATTYPALKERYDRCAENYRTIIDDLSEARKALKARDMDTFMAVASGAYNGPATCDHGFFDSEEAPAEPQQLRDANNKLKGLCATIVDIAERLGGKKMEPTN